MWSVGVQDFLDPADLSARLRRICRVVARHQQVNFGAELLRRRDRVERGLPDRLVVVLREDEDSHQITFASLRSLSTRAFASATLVPALRLGGSTTFSTLNRGETSTPSASGLSTSSVFFLAFMIFGSVT